MKAAGDDRSAGGLMGFAEFIRRQFGCDVVAIRLTAPFEALFAGAGRASLQSSGFYTARAVSEDCLLQDCCTADLLNPIVAADFGFELYASLPLRLPSGEIVGTLAALARNPRAVTDEQLAELRTHGKTIVQLIDLGPAPGAGNQTLSEKSHSS